MGASPNGQPEEVEALKKYPYSLFGKEEIVWLKNLWDCKRMAQNELPRFKGSHPRAKHRKMPLKNCPKSLKRWRDVI